MNRAILKKGVSALLRPSTVLKVRSTRGMSLTGNVDQQLIKCKAEPALTPSEARFSIWPKKAQVSIFLVVGLVAIMIVAFLLIMKEDNLVRFKTTSATPLDTHIKLCEQQATECLLYRLGATSGKMIFTPGVLPVFEDTQFLAQKYAKNTPSECFEFDKFPGQTIAVNGITPNPQMNHENLLVEFDNDITTKEEGQERRANNQMIKVPVHYKAMYDEAVRFRNAQEAEVPRTHVPMYNHAFDVQIIEEEKAPLFILTDAETKLRNQFYQFYFTRD